MFLVTYHHLFLMVCGLYREGSWRPRQLSLSRLIGIGELTSAKPESREDIRLSTQLMVRLQTVI